MRLLLLLLALLGPLASLSAQDDDDEGGPSPDPALRDAYDSGQKAAALLGMQNFSDEPRGNEGMRVVFYNSENLFDTLNDPKTLDEDFTPSGMYHWTAWRYDKKLDNLYKVITAVGGWESPDIVGFCELENRRVVEDLLRRTPLRRDDYDIVHENSADARGIDVGLIYRKSKFKYLHHEKLRPRFPDTTIRTRDVLYVRGVAMGKDTLHLFVNHWPSRRGGQVASEPRRVFVAEMLRQKVDSILRANPAACILIMGDLNDHPEDKSVFNSLRAKGDPAELRPGDLYNYMYALSKNPHIGTHKFQGHWGILDHIIVSQGLLKGNGRLGADPAGAQIFSGEFLMKEDERHYGLQPLRTFSGPRYVGGFSDHLPVFLDIRTAKE